GALEPRRLGRARRRPARRAREDRARHRRLGRRAGRPGVGRRGARHDHPRRVRRRGGRMTATATEAKGAERPLVPLTSRTWVKIAGGAVVPLVVLAAWWAVTAGGLVPPYQLPPPASVIEAGAELIQRGELWLHIAISLQRVILGFVFGSVIALAFAAVVGLSRVGEILLSPMLVALRAVPSLAWVPLLILW